MVMMRILYSLDLIAFAMGSALLVWSMKNVGAGSTLGKFTGTAVMALAIICALCTYSCAMKTECHRPMGVVGAEQPADMGQDQAVPAHAKKVEHHK